MKLDRPLGRLLTSVHCPSVQRVLAVANRVDVRVLRDEIDLESKPDDFLRQSPTGTVPLFRFDGKVLYESSVIAGWMAEVAGWEDGWPDEPYRAWRHRLAIRQWDEVVVQAFRIGLEDDRSMVERREDVLGELDWIEELIRTHRPSTDSMLGLSLGPYWQRFRWLEDELRFSDWFQGYDVLVSWLDELLDHPSVKQSAPDRFLTVRAFKRGRISRSNLGE